MAIARTCMRDEIRNVIVARILEGQYAPGTHLKEMVLAQEFKVSQAPVREALRELEALGLVESQRYCGTRVRGIDLQELQEAYELRAEIEDAAARRAVPVAPADLDRLAHLLDDIRRYHGEDQFDAYRDASVNFHRSIVELSGNRLFLRAWDNMAWDVRVRIAVQRLGLTRMFNEDRQQILDSLRAGDGRRAGLLLRGMLERMSARLQTQMEQESDGGNVAQPVPAAKRQR